MSDRRLRGRLLAWAKSESPPQNTDDAESGRKILSADLWSFGIGAAVAGYFCADYLAFYSPAVRAVVGLSAILAIVMVHRGVSTRTRWKRLAWLAPVFLTLLTVLLIGGEYIISAGDAAAAAEVRCAHIQHEMLKPHPRRADLPDIFEALGCHASGREDISLPTSAAGDAR